MKINRSEGFSDMVCTKGSVFFFFRCLQCGEIKSCAMFSNFTKLISERFSCNIILCILYKLFYLMNFIIVEINEDCQTYLRGTKRYLKKVS